MKIKLWSSVAAAAILLGGAYGISEVQGAAGGNSVLPSPTTSSSPSTSTDTSTKTLIGFDKAEEAALQAAQGWVKSIDLKQKNSGTYYKVELRQSNQEIDVRVDAYTGKILSVRKEKEDDDDDDAAAYAAASGKTLIGAAKAATAATASVKGNVTEIDLDEDDGRFIYEVEIKDGRQKTEVGVDAFTGEVLYIDKDEDDDD